MPGEWVKPAAETLAVAYFLLGGIAVGFIMALVVGTVIDRKGPNDRSPGSR